MELELRMGFWEVPFCEPLLPPFSFLELDGGRGIAKLSILLGVWMYINAVSSGTLVEEMIGRL